MYSDLGDKTSALAEIGRIRDLRQNGAAAFADLQPEKIDYLEGNLLFWYRDLDQALDDMKRVTAKARDLDLNTGIMSWMRLGQIYDLNGRHVAAVAAYKKAVAMAPLSEAGKESRRYVTQPYKRPQVADSAQETAKN
jgi:tetratricopeptide (TPR) repeat protein